MAGLPGFANTRRIFVQKMSVVEPARPWGSWHRYYSRREHQNNSREAHVPSRKKGLDVDLGPRDATTEQQEGNHKTGDGKCALDIVHGHRPDDSRDQRQPEDGTTVDEDDEPVHALDELQAPANRAALPRTGHESGAKLLGDLPVQCRDDLCVFGVLEQMHQVVRANGWHDVR